MAAENNGWTICCDKNTETTKKNGKNEWMVEMFEKWKLVCHKLKFALWQIENSDKPSTEENLGKISQNLPGLTKTFLSAC